MRRRITALSEGKFNQDTPILRLEPENIELTFYSGQDVEGSFVVQSESEVPLRGIVYTTNTRIQVVNPQFEGCETEIKFHILTQGLSQHEIQKGKFIIICNGGERQLPITAVCVPNYPIVNEKEITSLSELNELAKVSFEEAVTCIRQKGISNLDHLCQKDRLYLSAFAHENAGRRELEELLISTGMKKRVEITLSSIAELVLDDDVNHEILSLERDGYGCIDLKINCDCEWIKLEKEQYTGEDFVGKRCQIPVQILSDKLHAGKNIGSITIRGIHTQLLVTITKYHGHRNPDLQNIQSQERKLWLQLEQGYVSYRLHLQTQGIWASNSLSILHKLTGLFPENNRYDLYQAQILLITGRRQEAEWILSEFQKKKQRENSVEWGYYLYLSTFLTKDREYVLKVLPKIQEIYKSNNEDLLVFWILLYLDDSLEYHRERRFRLLMSKWMERKDSPILLSEIWSYVSTDPILLTELNGNTIYLVQWGIHKGTCTQQMAEHLIRLSENAKGNPKALHKVLTSIYFLFPTKSCLEAIIGNLLRSGIQIGDSAKWYQKGIEEKSTRSGLYEAYLMSLREEKPKVLPREVYLYFQLKNNLPAKQKAWLYVSLLQDKKENLSLYIGLRNEVERFVLSQLENGMIDECHGRLYTEVLHSDTLNHDTARLLAKVMFYHKLVFYDKEITGVTVKHLIFSKEEYYPVVHGFCYLPLYGEDYVFTFYKRGIRIGGEQEYDLVRLFPWAGYLNKALEMAPEQEGLLAAYFSKRRKEEPLTISSIRYLNILISKENISEEWLSMIRPCVVKFYQTQEMIELQDEFLKCLSSASLVSSVGRQMAELMIQRKMYQEAYAAILKYGSNGIKASLLLSLYSEKIQEIDGEADDQLIALTNDIFKAGAYNDVTLTYLEAYGNGANKELLKIWKACKGFDIDTYRLEERTLVQMLYTDDVDRSGVLLYDSYRMKKGKEIVLSAFENYKAYRYLVYDETPDDALFTSLISRMKESDSFSECIRIGVLKYISNSNAETDNLNMAKKLYHSLVVCGKSFSFFLRLPAEVTKELPVDDRIILEFHYSPGKRLVLNYQVISDASPEGEYQKKDLIESFYGVYTVEMVLFFGEIMQYYVTLEDNDEKKTILSNEYRYSEVFKNSNSAFAKLNDILYQDIAKEDSMALQENKKHFAKEINQAQIIFSNWREEVCRNIK